MEQRNARGNMGALGAGTWRRGCWIYFGGQHAGFTGHDLTVLSRCLRNAFVSFQTDGSSTIPLAHCKASISSMLQVQTGKATEKALPDFEVGE